VPREHQTGFGPRSPCRPELVAAYRRPRAAGKKSTADPVPDVGWLAKYDSGGQADRKTRDRMALGFYITGKGFTQEKYDTTTTQLDKAGAGTPVGRISHVALETDGEIQVFDIWESQEAFEAFGATLIPILTAAGIELNEPMVARVHNTIAA
jgi:hypothetical protein